MRAGKWLCTLIASSWIGLTGGCGVRLFDGWAGHPVLRRNVAADREVVWTLLHRMATDIDLVVAEIRPDDHIIEFDWITAPGDGRLYLRCRDGGNVGSASLKPRISIEATKQGSAIVIGSQVRATTNSSCESTGQFERWLLRRFEPAIAAAVDTRQPGLAPTLQSR